MSEAQHDDYVNALDSVPERDEIHGENVNIMSEIDEHDYENNRESVEKRAAGKILRENIEIASFEKFLGRDVGILRIAGLHSIKSVFTDNVFNPTIWEAVAFGIGIIHIFFVASCEFSTIIRVWSDDPNYAIGSFTAMFSGLLCAVKGLRLWFWRDEFRKLLRHFAIMWDEAKFRVRIKNENINIAAETWHVSKYYMIMVITLVTSYAVRPYILLLNYHLFEKHRANVTYDFTVTIYPTTYPLFTTETMSKYIICVSWEQLVIIFVALYWMSSDIMFAQLTTHTAIQFRVLRHDLEYVTDADDIDDPKNEKIFIKRLSTIARRHRDLYTYCEMIERIYNPIIFLTMLLTGVNMCFCVFRLEKEMSHRNWDEVIKYLFHAVTLIVQAIIYCGYADKLTQQTSLMSRAAYDCQWTDRSKEFKILLHIIMMRSQKPYNCTAYGFFNANLNQITTIANTAASYFALLKTMT